MTSIVDTNKMSSQKQRYTKIEETALLQADSPSEDFAYHFYTTRYDRLKGIRTPSEYSLTLSVESAITDSLKKNVVDLKLLNDEGRNAVAWSMNWFRCRDVDNKTWRISDALKAKLMDEYKEYSTDIPLHSEMFIFQGHDQDMVLVAVSMEAH